MAETEPVVIDGYPVDPHQVDLFYNADTGDRVTDEQWDISRDRLRAAEAEEAS
jgi:hypothetical protein